MKRSQHPTYWKLIWNQYCKRKLGVIALLIVILFALVGIYAPFLASSKPLVVRFQGSWYFPLFRYLFYPGFFTKHLDIFYNLLMFTLPVFIIACMITRKHSHVRFWVLGGILLSHCLIFLFLIIRPPHDPAVNPRFNKDRQRVLQEQLQAQRSYPLLAPPILPDWQTELRYLNFYAQLNLVLKYQQYKDQQEMLEEYEKDYVSQASQKGQSNILFPSLWNLSFGQENDELEREEQTMNELSSSYPQAKILVMLFQQICQPKPRTSLSSIPPWIVCDYLNKLSNQSRQAFLNAKSIVDKYEKAQSEIKYLNERHLWLEGELKLVRNQVMPLIRPFHWEDDAGGDQRLNHYVQWWDLTRINRKDMVAALLFGIRVSLSVGILAIGLALLIGIPVGAISGYYGGKLDLIVYRLIEIWESMPTFFMLLMIVAFLQSKSIFLVIAVIGLFGWTQFSRFVRGEFLRQKQLLYVEACHALGYQDRRIIFSHLLPNAIPPLLTLVPFAIMGAITSEAALSFLGLGEEGSNSWGVLMDEGRTAFPSESYLLWPPAILLTILLVSIALVGDSLRDALDPKLRS